jgi:site-specific DNA recombinase
MREKFTTGSVPFRKTYLQSLIDVVEVDDHQIRIKGSKDVWNAPFLRNNPPHLVRR